ncbi:SPOR domain-containing protein [uncultured Brevundimonas sp.]|uniref:SPOR domain-containing protein n=1 Tax=uncultured Brevundimonas sp. TaxID=213418 RepID=UPI00262B881B|nr:SPOR domain-containing protein [uncultured Brevundimonas sp.]
MSYDDDNRGYPQQGRDPRGPGPERGAYTPPTDDDLPFSRSGYDPRRAPASKSPPLTLIISVVVLLAIIIGIIVAYTMGGSRKDGQMPPAVGTSADMMKVEAPLDAQPVNPEDGIRVYRDTAETDTATPTLTEGPEEVLPRPTPSSEPLATPNPTPAPAPAPAAAPKATTPAPTPAPAPAPKATPAPQPAPAPAAATGNSRVQIGAFSSREQAEAQYSAAASRHGGLTSGARRQIEAIERDGKTLYRTSFGGLSRERATSLCNAIKASGGSCFVG